MKTSKDPRHLERIKVMQELFSFAFSKEQKAENRKSQLILSNVADIDNWIEKSAPKWDVSKINRIDLAILRMAVYELMVEKSNPPKVIVDESVELAKEYGSEASPGFINGALGKLISDNKLL
ncbi:MAG TPA: transcription antitermination factor NusB [Patescibacteria group bacterium]|nr:transcription antitermination factor NusB [Patescibacteria group bacterium]